MFPLGGAAAIFQELAAPVMTSSDRPASQPSSGGFSTSPTLSGAAGRYAEALFDLARDEKALETVEGDLKTLRAAMDDGAEFRDFLTSPVYTRDDQEAAIAAIAQKAGAAALTTNFLRLVAQKGRLFSLEKMIDEFTKLAAHARGEVEAEATSAASLSDEQTKRLRGEIEGLVGRAVSLRTKVDPDLLGGLVVKIGSTMIDSSLRTKLNKLKTAMKEA